MYSTHNAKYRYDKPALCRTLGIVSLTGASSFTPSDVVSKKYDWRLRVLECVISPQEKSTVGRDIPPLIATGALACPSDTVAARGVGESVQSKPCRLVAGGTKTPQEETWKQKENKQLR